jgi:hypothetical protein
MISERERKRRKREWGGVRRKEGEVASRLFCVVFFLLPVFPSPRIEAFQSLLSGLSPTNPNTPPQMWCQLSL